ncbi:MAG: right-handed parallel beta-helix repeat-containing protein [Thermoguttaceae bacterium]|nr:right-handed parallel beta-helix repeat-containing protein [Thermoguttaceae bacterium]
MRRFFSVLFHASGAPFAQALLVFLCLACAAYAQDSVLKIERELADDSVKANEPFDVSTGSFTVAVRARLIEPGGEKGNGDDNAMLWNVSNGWEHGMRVIFQWDSARFGFQIGSEEVKGGAWTPRGYFPGVMRDVVATYDAAARKMSLYVDGELAQSSEFSGALTTQDQPLNVGFGGSGVGSSRMYVDRAETWTRALSEKEIAERHQSRPESERLAVDVLRSVEVASSSCANLDVSADALKAALKLELPEKARARLRLNLVATLGSRDYAVDRNLETADYDEYAALVFEDAAAALEKSESNAKDAPVSNEELEIFGRTKRELENINRISAANLRLCRTFMSSTSFNSEQNRQFREKCRETIDKFGVNVSRATAALKKLDEERGREAAVYAKIGKLEDSIERVQRIERDALGVYYSLTTASRSEKFARHIAVSPKGSDETGNGSTRAPFASLARAFREVQENPVKSADGSRAVSKTVINVAPGRYYTTEPATLANASNVFVVGAEDNKTVFSGAREIDNFTTLADAAKGNDGAKAATERLAKEARGRIFVADLKAAGVEDLGTLRNRGYSGGSVVNAIPTFTLDGKAQTLARWPNDGEEKLQFGEKLDAPEGAPENSSTFRYDFDRVDRWKLEGENDDIWAFGLFQWEWAADFRRVLKIDREAKTITFDYKDGSGKFDYYFVNVLEELDQPGEYYVDRASGLLFFYPPEGIRTAEELNNATAEYDVYEGRFIELKDVSDVAISNVCMSGGRETAVSMKDCKRCYLTDVTIEQMGGNGVVISGGEFCGVVNSRLRSLGGSGILMSGGDPETLTPCRHLVHNNYVSDFSRIDRVYAPAASAYGCGFAITNNLFCDSPHHGMRTDGQDIYVARNEIHSVVYEYSDQSGIDIYCDPSFRGIVIERNLWRHIGSSFALCGQAGIRLDDSISGVVMKENVFYRSSGGHFGGIQIHGGKDNLVVRNAFVDCQIAASFTPWGGDRYETFVKEQFSKHVENELYKKTYPFFDEIFEHYNRNYVLDNQAINCGRFNSSGDNENLFVGNVSRTETPDLKQLGVKGDELMKSPEEVFYTNEKALKKWLSDVSGISLKDVGLKANWKDAGEPVSPRFIGGAGAGE